MSASPQTAPATVGVNLLWLVPGVVGGSEESTVGALRAIADRPPDDLRVVLFALGDFVDAYPDLGQRLSTVTLPLSGRLKPARVAAERTWLRAQLRRHGIDLVHHAGGTMPTRGRRPAVVTIHDLQPLERETDFSPARVRYLRWTLPRAARRASLLVTPSAFVRTSVIETLGADPARVVVVPHGVDPAPPATDPETVRRRYDLPGPFFLFPAITYTHKNHEMLVRAFAAVAESRPDVVLVLTGRAGPADAAVAAEIARLRLGGRIRRPGRLPAADLAGLMAEATALVFPSRYEGFGLPVLEAMARGRPVVAAGAAALPEVVGAGGRLLDPDDQDRWSEAMTELLTDPASAAAWAAAARNRAEAFSWAATARGLLDAYRHALGPTAPEPKRGGGDSSSG